MKNLNNDSFQSIQLVDEIFINLILIVHEKLLNIPDVKVEDFEDNINLYVLCLLLSWNAVHEILKKSKRRRFINKIFQSPLRESSFSILYFVGLLEFFTNVFPIVISDFYTIIKLYTIKPTVFKSVDDDMIKQRRNSNTDSNDNFYPYGVLMDEWEELGVISSSKIINN